MRRSEEGVAPPTSLQLLQDWNALPRYYFFLHSPNVGTPYETNIGVRWGGGNTLLRTALIFLLPGRVERGGGPGPGFLRLFVRPSGFLRFP